MDDEYLDRLSPQAIEAERSVLGSVLIQDPSLAKVADFLRPEDFYRRQHADIYEGMLSLFRKREPIDLVTLGDELERNERLEAIGGPSYLTTLMIDVPTAQHIVHYGRIVRDKARLRRLIDAAGKISAAAYEEANDADEAEARAAGILLEATAGSLSDGGIVTPKQQADVLVDLLERRARGESLGMQTGFSELDHATGGLKKGNLYILGARPGAGKSSWAECLSEHLAKREKFVVFVSLEMDTEQMMERWASREGQLSSVAINNGRLTEQEWESLWKIAQRRSEMALYLVNKPGASLASIQALIEQLAMQEGRQPDLVVIDYLQLINEPRERGESRNDQVGRMSRSMKLFARSAGVPMLVLSQLSRDGSRRGSDPEPRLTDLRDSGAIEQDADLVLMFWKDNDDIFHAKIEKQRNGPECDLVRMHFDMRTYRFYENAA